MQVFSASGEKIARVRHAERELKLTIDKNVSTTFAAFLVDQLPALFDAFSKTSGGQENYRGLTASSRKHKPGADKGKEKKAPKQSSGSLLFKFGGLTENHFRESQSRVSTRFNRRFRRADFLAQLRQRTAVTLSNDALWAAIVEALPMWQASSGPRRDRPKKVVHKWNVFHAICTARPSPWGVGALAFRV